jgi:hypothetical protein
VFYKYRTLDNFKYVVDIFVNQRLYATTIEDMNDPMEGTYTFNDDIPQDAISALEDYQKKIKFCSVSKNENSPLMWAHYANGARGIIIGVELSSKVDCREVKYRGPSHLLSNKATDLERAKRVLCYKNDFWDYEEEYRLFAASSNFVYVKVKKVIFGEKADKSDKALLKKIINNLKYEIEIIEKGI